MNAGVFLHVSGTNRVSNISAGMISRKHFHKNPAEFAVLSTFTGQGN